MKSCSSSSKIVQRTFLGGVCPFVGSYLAHHLLFVWKKSSITTSIKDLAGNILRVEWDILSQQKEYFENLLNLVTATLTNTWDTIDFEEEEIFTLAEVVAATQWLKSGKAGEEDEIRPVMLKTLNGEVRWITRVCQVTWKPELGQWQAWNWTGSVKPIWVLVGLLLFVHDLVLLASLKPKLVGCFSRMI